jgi:hypothetical protein
MSSYEITVYSIQVDLDAMIETDARVQRVGSNFLLYWNPSTMNTKIFSYIWRLVRVRWDETNLTHFHPQCT